LGDLVGESKEGEKGKGRREERFTIYDLRSLSNIFDKAILEKEKYLGRILDADSVMTCL